jgi:hypothetical protein
VDIRGGLETGARRPRLTKYERYLILLFLLSLPLSNPLVRGDGVGYYAFARSILIEHKLDFRKDWLEANTSFRMGRTDANGNIAPEQYTVTGHINNHFSVGPAILWAPFLVVTHLGVLLYDHLGGHLNADGFSPPYLLTMALATALYGFLALLISFWTACRYVPERFAFLGTLGIWLASSLPAYMYFNPSWSHALSAFVASMFLWYWLRTRIGRSPVQWALLGLIGGLMLDTYYITAVLLLLPLLESLSGYWKFMRSSNGASALRLFWANTIFSGTLLISFFPTLVTKKILFGSFFTFGYTEPWFWYSPAFWKTAFSSDHGLFSWTPLLLLSVFGLFFLRRYDRQLSWSLFLTFLLFLYVIGCYANWAGISSFGNRYFVSLTPIFVLGLASFFDAFVPWWGERRALVVAVGVLAAFSIWNAGMLFQWGTHLIPARGPISWRDAAYNQVAVVPVQAGRTLKTYLFHRKKLMNRIELDDVKQLKSEQSGETK